MTGARTYRGVTIWRNDSPGHRLRWTAGRLAADTLQGLKALIREQEGVGR
jgi:hypothetical protein